MSDARLGQGELARSGSDASLYATAVSLALSHHGIERPPEALDTLMGVKAGESVGVINQWKLEAALPDLGVGVWRCDPDGLLHGYRFPYDDYRSLMESRGRRALYPLMYGYNALRAGEFAPIFEAQEADGWRRYDAGLFNLAKLGAALALGMTVIAGVRTGRPGDRVLTPVVMASVLSGDEIRVDGIFGLPKTGNRANEPWSVPTVMGKLSPPAGFLAIRSGRFAEH